MTCAGRVVLMIAALATTACSSPVTPVDNLSVDCQLDPSSPTVGETTVVSLTLHESSGAPVQGAAVNLEGHMTHPGMRPVVVPLGAQGGGRYRAAIALTMAGDWQLVVIGRLADGRIVRQQVAAVVATAKE